MQQRKRFLGHLGTIYSNQLTYQTTHFCNVRGNQNTQGNPQGLGKCSNFTRARIEPGTLELWGSTSTRSAIDLAIYR